MIIDNKEAVRKKLGLNIESYIPITRKTAKIKCESGKCFFLKQTEFYTNEKYALLYSHGARNILYPHKNNDNRYILENDKEMLLLTDYIDQISISNEYKAKYLIEELSHLHSATKYKRVLTVGKCRKKMEELYEYLQYKFSVLESFVRSVECQPFDENSIIILKNYQYILNSKKIMANYNKKLVLDIKKNKSVYYSFVHNNPKIEHMLVSENGNYLVSIENSKMGIPVMDIVKFYLYNESLNIDIKQIILNYFSDYEDEFYYNYFYFFVMVYYIKGIKIIDKEYVTSQNFIFAARKLKKFIEMFELMI